MRTALAFLVLLLAGCGRSDVVDDAPAVAAPAPITTCAPSLRAMSGANPWCNVR